MTTLSAFIDPGWHMEGPRFSLFQREHDDAQTCRGAKPSPDLVIAAIGVMVRLGIWQLERLAQRQAFNSRVTEQIELPALELSGDSLNLDLASMEYRAVVVIGFTTTRKKSHCAIARTKIISASICSRRLSSPGQTAR